MKPRRARVVAERRSVGYVRVSTEDQAREGVSLDAQEARIAAYCQAMGWNLSEVVRDAGESAKSLKRPGIGALFEAVSHGEIERIIVAKLDRLTRSVRDLVNLIDLCGRHDVALVSVSESLDTGSTTGELLVHILGVIAQWERRTIVDRVTTALAYKRRQRSAYGPTPFGYRREGHVLVPVDGEQAALHEAMRLDRAGASFREIAAMLENRGAVPHRAKRWHASSVRAMLRSRIATEAVA